MVKRIFAVLLVAALAATGFSQQKPGYRINVAVAGLHDSTLYLAYHFGDKQYLRDTLRLDRNGRGAFSKNEPLPQGIYMVVMPGKKYFEILLPENQNFTISCSYPDFFSTLNFTGSQENIAFLNYQHDWRDLQESANQISTRLRNNRQNSDSLRIITEIGKKNDEKMKNYLNNVVRQNKGNILGMVVRSIIPVEIPEFTVPSYISNKDSVRWIRAYIYNKVHFFDNIDFSDERILRTPILYNRLNTYFSNVLIQHPDSIISAIDILMPKFYLNKKVFQFIAVYLFNHFRESETMGHDAILVKLADEIYLSGKADWTTREWRDNLRKEVDRVRPNLIGVKAHDLVMSSFNGEMVSLYDIKKDFVILYFWEPNCGHCQEETPKLKAYYNKARYQGVEVFAVCTQNDRAKWEKFIQENKLDWINGWDPQRATNYDYYYNINSTPTVFILDRNKTIIAKKLPVESISSFIDSYRKYHKTSP